MAAYDGTKHHNSTRGGYVMDTQAYVVSSLELHLFFARIMKEHAFFLKVSLLPPNADLEQEGERLMRQFEALLSRTIALSDHVVRSCVLKSGEIVTEFTDRAECRSQQFTGTYIDRGLTARAMRLAGQDCNADLCISQALALQVQQLNRDGSVLVDRLINYKERLLHGVGTCGMFTVSYPLLIEHILREARLYLAYLMQLEGCGDCNCQELRSSELFWDQIMMEHALFIRGLLDPSEDELISAADDFAEDYQRLLGVSAAANDKILMRGADALALTRKFRDFKRAGVEGIEECKIRSIILPLLADHVLREANHYIRLLEK